jgi:uncharacterized Tic20 family protein
MEQQGGGAPPGWYPDQSGAMRWWDGGAWGVFAPAYGGPPPPNKTLAIVAHLGPVVGGFILPLIIYLVADKRDTYVRHHASEGLNFALTFLIAWVVGIIVFIIAIGGSAAVAGGNGGGIAFAGGFVLVWFVLFGLAIASWVFAIIAAIAASQGRWYRYPICIRFVQGAMPADTPPILV